MSSRSGWKKVHGPQCVPRMPALKLETSEECVENRRPRANVTFSLLSFAAGYVTMDILGVLLPLAESSFSR